MSMIFGSRAGRPRLARRLTYALWWMPVTTVPPMSNGHTIAFPVIHAASTRSREFIVSLLTSRKDSIVGGAEGCGLRAWRAPHPSTPVLRTSAEDTPLNGTVSEVYLW